MVDTLNCLLSDKLLQIIYRVGSNPTPRANFLPKVVDLYK